MERRTVDVADEPLVECEECGHEQADMGHGVQCEQCECGPMPVLERDDEGRAYVNQWEAT